MGDATSNPDGRQSPPLTVSHGIGLSVGVALFSVVMTIAGMTVYLGGWLRQIDVNTGRLDRIETTGSPALKSFGVELDIVTKRVNAVDEKTQNLPARDATVASELAEAKYAIQGIRENFRSRDFWERLAGDIARLNVEVAQLNIVRERAVQEWATLVQRIATTEAEVKEMRNQLNRLSGERRATQ